MALVSPFTFMVRLQVVVLDLQFPNPSIRPLCSIARHLGIRRHGSASCETDHEPILTVQKRISGIQNLLVQRILVISLRPARLGDDARNLVDHTADPFVGDKLG